MKLSYFCNQCCCCCCCSCCKNGVKFDRCHEMAYKKYGLVKKWRTVWHGANKDDKLPANRKEQKIWKRILINESNNTTATNMKINLVQKACHSGVNFFNISHTRFILSISSFKKGQILKNEKSPKSPNFPQKNLLK